MNFVLQVLDVPQALSLLEFDRDHSSLQQRNRVMCLVVTPVEGLVLGPALATDFAVGALSSCRVAVAEAVMADQETATLRDQTTDLRKALVALIVYQALRMLLDWVSTLSGLGDLLSGSPYSRLT